MSDVNVESKPKREMIADRQWVDAEGNEVADETKATGFAYVWKASGRKFTYQLNATSAGNPETMLAIFGGLTKAGNIANTWKQLAENERGADPIDDIAEWFKALDEGKWGEERAGGVGARFDRAHLATAIAQVTGRPVDEFAKKLDANEKVADGKREILYGTWALRNPQVKAAYDKLVPPSNAPAVDAL